MRPSWNELLLSRNSAFLDWFHMWQASCILLGSSPITIHVDFDSADPSSMLNNSPFTLITKLKIQNLYSLCATHDFDRADPSSMQDACQILTQLMVLWPFCLWVLIHVAEWIEHLPGIQEVMGLSLVGASDFSLFHAYDMLNNSSFTFHYRT